jgi:hypothetical protein
MSQIPDDDNDAVKALELELHQADDASATVVNGACHVPQCKSDVQASNTKEDSSCIALKPPLNAYISYSRRPTRSTGP